MNTEQVARVLRSGQVKEEPARTELRAGPFTLLLEEGDLRYIRVGGVEVIRRIYVALRDRDWRTIPGAISELSIDRRPDCFRVGYTCEHREGEVAFRWQARIVGSADGEIRFGMDGLARSSFHRNRIGFCILHPMDLAGSPCRVEHPDGTATEGLFPVEISPHQPFTAIRRILQRHREGFESQLDLEGEVFEMEDQRNWTDASYKTYCTPLEIPFPVRVAEGTRVVQSVRLRLGAGARGGGGPLAGSAAPAAIELSPGARLQPRLPGLGIGINHPARELSGRERELLRALHPAHLRLDLDPSLPDAQGQAARTAAAAIDLGADLLVALQLSARFDEELRRVRAWTRADGWQAAWWLVFSRGSRATPADCLAAARQVLAPGRFASGTDAFFAELNRGRPLYPGTDAAVFSINPQVHAFDNCSLSETLQAQEAVVQSARAVAGGLPVLVSPVSFRMRFNPNATGPAAAPQTPAAAPPGAPPETVDLHQPSLYGAGWTAVSAKRLAAGGAAAVTFYEAAGWFGVLQGEEDPPLPEAFPARRGEVFPLYHALADLGELAGAELWDVVSAEPLEVEALELRRGGQRVILAANLADGRRDVLLRGFEGLYALRRLEESTQAQARAHPEAFRAAAGERLRLRPEGTAISMEACAYLRLEEVRE